MAPTKEQQQATGILGGITGIAGNIVGTGTKIHYPSLGENFSLKEMVSLTLLQPARALKGTFTLLSFPPLLQSLE